MGRFGIGARVRDYQNDEGVIVGKRKGERLMRYDDADYGELWWRKSELTLELASAEDAPAAQEPLQLQVGATYKTRDGRVVGPLRASTDDDTDPEIYPFAADSREFITPAWTDAGCYFASGIDADHDLVELVSEPAVTPTPVVAEATTEWVPKVGDRVRNIGEKGYAMSFPIGGTGIVTEATSDGCSVKSDLDGWVGYFYPHEIEPVVASATTDTRPDAGGGCKAGDRIRLISDPLPMMPIGSEFVAAERTGGAETSVHFTDHDGDTTWRPGAYFELVQPLTIKAGKSYKTRDGRKVGPMSTWATHVEHPMQDESGNIYRLDGTSNYGSPTLVAEWVEPVEPDQPATTGEVAPARFKIGDRVRVVSSDYEFKHSHIGREFEIHSHCGELDGEDTWNGDVGSASKPYRWKESELELAAAPTPQVGADSFIVARLTAKGEPRPNVRPRVHATLAEAEAEAQRLADRLGDEFAVYQRVSSKTVDAGPVPTRWGDPFDAAAAKEWLRSGDASAGDNAMAFAWDEATQGFEFWAGQSETGLTHLGRAILKKWIAEVEAAATIKEAA